MKRFFQNNLVFLALSLILIAVLGLVLCYIPKGELHLLLCDRHTHARDIFYRFYTQIAEWFPYVICVLILLFGRIGDGVLATACMAISGLVTQGLKYAADTDRPLTWFANHMPDITLPLVEGVRMSKFYSFPSGHTTSFFALALVLSMLVTNKTSKPTGIFLQIVLFGLAALGGYSRIYLSQHFTEDIVGGIAVGLLITILMYVIFYRFNGQKWYNYRIFQKK